MIRILMLGDIYGSVGRRVLSEQIPLLKTKYNLDFVIVNGENVTHGKSLSFKHYQFLKAIGVDIITSGNHIYKLAAVREYIKGTPDLLRPVNFLPYQPGNGTTVVKIKNKTLRITNLLGRMTMDMSENPYWWFEKEVLSKPATDLHIIDFHAEATSEKIAFALAYDGKITALAGTHTHVLTADARILPQGTAFITDLGMTGPLNSVIGVRSDIIINKERNGGFSHFQPATGLAQLTGWILTINDDNQVIDFEVINYREHDD